MRTIITISAVSVVLLTGCVEDHVNPQDEPTGWAPSHDVIYEIYADSAPQYLDANLERANSMTAIYVTQGGRILPSQVDGAFPADVGSDADLAGGIGFGTYVSPEYNGPGVDWTQADPFRHVLTAEVSLGGPGDAIRFCRTTGGTCASLLYRHGPDEFTGVELTAAAILPDTDAGEVMEGISAGVHDTGDAGLTIGLTWPDTVRQALELAPGQDYEFGWGVRRDAVVGSLEYAVSVDSEALLWGTTAEGIASDISREQGVTLEFVTTAAIEAEAGVDYGYEVYGEYGDFTDILGTDVHASPQPGLANAPAYLYPTLDPDFELLTYQGVEGVAHELQFADGILGGSDTSCGPGGAARVWSVAFNGDDFVGTEYMHAIDQGGDGGGFYPSVPFCYSQIYPTVREQVETGLRHTIHQRMYANMANGLASADASLPDLADGLSGFPFYYDVSYTPLGDYDGGDTEAYITLGTDFADSNVDAFLTTSAYDAFVVQWADSRGTQFADELGALIDALEANWGVALEGLILLGQMTEEDYADLLTLHESVTATRGMADGARDENGDVVYDDMNPPFAAETCQGADCLLEWTFQDVLLGTNESGNNPDPVPALAAVCLWGLAPSDEAPASPATLTGDYDNDHPAYDAIPADPGMAPVREQAAESINELIATMYGEFHIQAFGTAVPASNFSVAMEVGDPDGTASPAFRSIVITK